MRNFDTRLKRQQKKSADGSRAANIRWERQHAIDQERIVYDDPRPENMYRITVENLMTDEKHVLLFHPGDRMNNYRIDVDGTPWKTAGWSKAFDKIQASCNRLQFPRLGDRIG